MKKGISLLLALALLAALLPTAALAATTARTVTIFSVFGTVTMTKGTEKQFTAKADLKLYDGYTVSTSSGASCQLKLDDGSLLTMGQSSSIKVGKTSAGKISISVLSGGLAVDAETQSADSAVEVRVNNSALSIRGAYFIAENTADGQAIYTMFEGSGAVDGIDLPSRHVINVYGKPKTLAPGTVQDNQVYELTPFVASEGSAFVLETLMKNPGRFVDNGVIDGNETAQLENYLQERLNEIRNTQTVSFAVSTNYGQIVTGGNSGGGNNNSSNPNPSETNKAALILAIDVAERARVTAGVASAAAQVPYGDYWVTKEVMDALREAIATARVLLTKANMTVREVEQAATALTEATKSFQSNFAVGTYQTKSALVKDLLLMISATRQTLAVTWIAENADEVPADRSWIPQATYDEVSAALQSAEAFLEAGDLEAAQSKANEAAQTLLLSSKNGTALVSSEMSDAYALFSNALVSAYKAKENVLVGSDPAVLSNDLFTVSEKAWAEFNAAINAAVTIYRTAESNDDLNSATFNLLAATTSFNNAKVPGEVPPAPDRETLLRSLEQIGRYNVSDCYISEDGTDVPAGASWVTPAVWAAYDAVVSDIEDNVYIYATQAAVDAAFDRLWAAYAVFEAARNDAPNIELDLAALEEDYALLIKRLDELEVSEDGTDVAPDAYWIMPELYEELNREMANATMFMEIFREGGGTKQNLDSLTAALTSTATRLRVGMKPGLATTPGGCQIDGKYFDSLPDALASAKSGDTIKLLTDNTLAEAIMLDGVNLRIESGASLAVSNPLVNSGTITIMDGGRIEAHNMFENNGTIEIMDGGTIEPYGTLENNGTITVAGGGKILSDFSITVGTTKPDTATIVLAGVTACEDLMIGNFRPVEHVDTTAVFNNGTYVYDTATEEWTLQTP